MKVLLLLLTSILFVVNSAKLPSYFKKCNRKQADFNACLVESTQQAFAQITHPIPELNLPKIDPLDIVELNISGGNHRVVNVDQHFKNCKLYGISKAVVQKFEIDFGKKAVELVLTIPEIKKACDYTLNGNIMMLPVVGEGTSEILLQQIHVDFHMKYEETRKKDKTYVKFISNKLDFKPEHCTFDFKNLFNGDKVLGDNINKILNENWKDVYEDVEPTYREALGIIFQGFINGFFSKVSIEEAFD